MKNKFLILVLALAMSLWSCGPAAYITAPADSVPLRKNLERDVYGSYITLRTTDSIEYKGELIGIRNDTIVILSGNVRKDTSLVQSGNVGLINRNSVSSARVIVHLPNNYRVGGGALMGISGLVVVHAGTYGGGPVTLGLYGILVNGIGLASAQGTEDMMINYFDWSEGWEKVMIYSRFPKGIPAMVSLTELKPRSTNVD